MMRKRRTWQGRKRTLNVEKASDAISKLATSTFSKKSSTIPLSNTYLCVQQDSNWCEGAENVMLLEELH